MSDSRPEVRAAAAYAWGSVGDSHDGGSIDTLIADAAPEVRVAAASAAGRLAVMDSVPKLIAALDDKDRAVRESAWHALDRILGFKLAESKMTVKYGYNPDDPSPKRQAYMASLKAFVSSPPKNKTLREYWDQHQLPQ